ncbi:universal stress protein [Phycicoccus duodecadis]|uniref:Universal stress protein family protein n=1 Tax=Phycicoccus duodecadis TaxID=173053 RepID=A0A2N3YF91_9MICO|nr:universal stress protein [Phycicoccus duodecadis]PKW25509.1 universal stress protein family protein [Phycicoccus duodecadis]
MPIHPVPRSPGQSAPDRGSDVVAGLVHDGHTTAVAEAAVREAARRGSRVRFLQVLPRGLSEEAHANVETALFRIAVDALRAAPHLACTFESVVGTPAETLVEETRRADLLVLGADDPEAAVRVADHCRAHCVCEVLVVTDAGSGRSQVAVRA